MAASEIITFLKSLKRFTSRKPSLFILGGEPMLSSDKLIEVAKYTTISGFQMIVSTNGMDVPSEFVKWAKRFGMQVQVSLEVGVLLLQ